MSKNVKQNQTVQPKQEEVSIEDEVAAEQTPYNMTDEDHTTAQDLELTEAESDNIDKSLRSGPHSKGTGFETQHAKDQFKSNPYMTNYVDPFFMPKKDPSRVYKQIDFSLFRQNNYRDARGWIPLTKQNSRIEGFPIPGNEYGVAVQGDGFWHVGDRIWAWMPREAYAKIRHTLHLKTMARTKKNTEEFRKEGAKLGGNKMLYIEDEAKGI